MKTIHKIIKPTLLLIALSSLSLTAQARESLESLRTDLNAALKKITLLDSNNTAQQAQIAGLQAQMNALPVFFAIGDVGPAGGIVFYVSDYGLHGLEAAPADQGNARWGCSLTPIVGSDATAVGTGKQNTADILAGCDETGSAAQLTDAYELNGSTDWYLPSKDELELLSNQLAVVRGGFDITFYWSSTEQDTLHSWSYFFIGHGPEPTMKHEMLKVRAIRTF